MLTSTNSPLVQLAKVSLIKIISRIEQITMTPLSITLLIALSLGLFIAATKVGIFFSFHI